MDFDCAIFDLDGTLLDSMGVWDQIDIDFLAKRGIDVPDDYAIKINRMRSSEIAVYTIRRFHLKDKPEDLVQEWIDMAMDAYASRLPLKEGVFTYVRGLYERGIPMAVATSSDRALVLPALKRTGILPMMKAVVTSDDVRADKGTPEIYRYALARINEAAGRTGDTQIQPAACVVFEDILEGVQGAKAGGFRAVGVYDQRNRKNEEAIRAASDRYIRSFTELSSDENLF